MPRPHDIPASIWERAEILMDEFSGIEDDRELVARILMSQPTNAAAGITPKQAEVLQFVQSFIAANGYSPSLAEISAATGAKSRSQAHAIVQQLRLRNLVTCQPNRTRSIMPVMESHP